MSTSTVTTLQDLDAFVGEQISLGTESENRSGATPLEELSIRLSALDADDRELQVYQKVVLRRVNEIPTLAEKAVTRLIKFILTVQHPTPELMLPAAQRLFKTKRPRLSVNKRADLLSLLRRIGPRFIPTEIQAEHEICRHRPWLWFDVAWTASPSVAKEALSDLANHPEFFPAMLSRVVSIWKNSPSDFLDFVADLKAVLAPAQRLELNKYIAGFKIPVPDLHLLEEQDSSQFTDIVERISYTSSLRPA